jgi:hypothetical protein
MKEVILIFILTFGMFGCAGIDYKNHSAYEKNYRSYDRAKKCYEKLKISENGKEAEELKKIILKKYDSKIGSEYVRMGIEKRLNKLVKKAYERQKRQERQKREEDAKKNNTKDDKG